MNALRIILDDVGGAAPGLGISGEIVIAHSYSELVAVPEPGTAVLLGLGLLGLTAVSRPRR